MTPQLQFSLVLIGTSLALAVALAIVAGIASKDWKVGLATLLVLVGIVLAAFLLLFASGGGPH